MIDYKLWFWTGMKRIVVLCFSLLICLEGFSMKKERIHITCEDGHEMAVLVYRPENSTTDAATGILWIHGGGYITGMASMAGMMGMGPRLVKDHGCVVISPEYRLGRKGRYPNALNDCYAALKYMLAHAEELGIRKDQIFVGGESAGGGLCAALCMLARDRGEVNIAFQIPLYPMIDDRDTDSSRDNRSKVWNTKRNHYGWKTYLGEMNGTDDVPAYAAAARQTDYANLPPAYTFVCTGEPFYCETLAFVESLRAAGVEAGLDVYDGLYHAFDMLQPGKEVSKTAIGRFETAFDEARKKYFANNN